jgi:hypothetical protein
MRFKLVYIPVSFKNSSTEAFDKVYMKNLFDFGNKLGRTGYKWKSTPLGI